MTFYHILSRLRLKADRLVFLSDNNINSSRHVLPNELIISMYLTTIL